MLLKMDHLSSSQVCTTKHGTIGLKTCKIGVSRDSYGGGTEYQLIFAVKKVQMNLGI